MNRIERNIKEIIKKYKLEKKLNLEMMKSWIYNEKGKTPIEASNKYSIKYMKFFSQIEDQEEMNIIIKVFTDAWNYFPHKILEAKSPIDIYKKELKKQSRRKSKSNKMPRVRVGDREFSWYEYQKFLDLMHKTQEPFKQWIDKHVLIGFKKHVKENYKKELSDKIFSVAEIFFERVLWVGFTDFETIRPEFVIKEFPKWWLTHVIGNKQEQQDVRNNLKILFEYINKIFGDDISKFDFKFKS